METQPLISIGITTYNRIDFLKKLVQCLVKQDSQNVEILIGNDFVKQKINFSDLDLPFNVKNIKIFNYPVNLGEYKNLVYLFKKSTGKYFTWQFDDDFYSFNYLRKMKVSINKFNPDCIYSNFDFLYDKEEYNQLGNNKVLKVKKYSGESFIINYFKRKTPTMGLTGLYKRSFLEKIGILPLATKGRFALYSEYLLLIHSTKLSSIIYHEEKLIFNRIHSGSFSVDSSDSQYFYDAGQGLIELASDIIENEKLKRKVMKFFSISIIKTNFSKSKSDYKNLTNAYDYSISILTTIKNYTSKLERLIILSKLPLYALKSILYPRKYLSFFHKIKTNSFIKYFIEPNF